MAFTQAKRTVNPRLGMFFAIFASAYACVVLLALMAEEMGSPRETTRWAMLVAPFGLYIVIGISAGTRDSLEFFAAGRRVPAVYSGFALAFSAFGGTGLAALTGTLFLIGFDALCLVIGGLAGFVVMGILLAPFFRKFGAYTIPTYLGRRFDSPALRTISAAIIVLPLALMLMAELKMAVFMGVFLTGAPAVQIAAIVALVLIATLVPGGMRSLTWSGVAQTIAAFLAILVPVAVVAVMWTNLPLPQLSHGPLMRVLGRQEALQGLPIVIAQGLTFDVPNEGIQSIGKRFATTFSAVGPGGFVAATLTVMMGVACAPWLLPRIATAPGVYHARKSIGWATLVFGVVMLTAASVAVFARALLLEGLAAGGIPDWVKTLAQIGYAEVDTRPVGAAADAARSLLGGIGLSRDIVLLALPMAAQLADVFVALAAAGVIAACLAGASAAGAALSATLSEDAMDGRRAEPPADAVRLFGARFWLVATVVGGSALAALIPGDPLDMLLWSLALTGSSLFSVLVLSIWWKRTNAFGAVAGLCAGFGVALLAIAAGHYEWVPVDAALAGVFGIPASLIATVAATLSTPKPGRHVMELVRDIRVPGGEILYDREMRLLRLKTRQRTQELM
jgi:cation/acetate symporter